MTNYTLHSNRSITLKIIEKLAILNTLSQFSENISPKLFQRETRISFAKSRAAFYVPSVTIKSFRHIIRRNYASSENLDLTSVAEESKLVLANLWSARGEIYAFRILFLFLSRIQEERVDMDRGGRDAGGDAVISQVCAPASRFSDRAGHRSRPERSHRRGARYLCFVYRRGPCRTAECTTANAPSGTRARVARASPPLPFPPLALVPRTRTIDDQVVRRCRQSRQKELFRRSATITRVAG